MRQTAYSIPLDATVGYNESSLTHLSKRYIENSPDIGATLSSDLLCLSLLDNGYLAAAGVDGRLQLWLPGYKVKDAICSIRVHDGRVNALLFAPKAQLLFSTGHDGCLHTIRHTSGMLTLDTSLLIEGSPRLTAARIISDENESVYLGLGISRRMGYVRACRNTRQRKQNVAYRSCTAQRQPDDSLPVCSIDGEFRALSASWACCWIDANLPTIRKLII
jgi:WD40 repeat protein